MIMGDEKARYRKDEQELREARIILSTECLVIGNIVYTETSTSLHGAHIMAIYMTNQIDHIIVIGRYRRSLLDARVMGAADTNDNNHHLVMARVKLKL